LLLLPWWERVGMSVKIQYAKQVWIY